MRSPATGDKVGYIASLITSFYEDLTMQKVKSVTHGPHMRRGTKNGHCSVRRLLLRKVQESAPIDSILVRELRERIEGRMNITGKKATHTSCSILLTLLLVGYCQGFISPSGRSILKRWADNVQINSYHLAHRRLRLFSKTGELDTEVKLVEDGASYSP